MIAGDIIGQDNPKYAEKLTIPHASNNRGLEIEGM